MGGKVLRASALYPRNNLKRMDILATARWCLYSGITGHFKNQLTEAGATQKESQICMWQMDLKVVSSSPAIGDFSCGRRSIQGWNCKLLK
jgi:hypothetical protein